MRIILTIQAGTGSTCNTLFVSVECCVQRARVERKKNGFLRELCEYERLMISLRLPRRYDSSTNKPNRGATGCAHSLWWNVIQGPSLVAILVCWHFLHCSPGTLKSLFSCYMLPKTVQITPPSSILWCSTHTNVLVKASFF